MPMNIYLGKTRRPYCKKEYLSSCLVTWSNKCTILWHQCWKGEKRLRKTFPFQSLVASVLTWWMLRRSIFSPDCDFFAPFFHLVGEIHSPEKGLMQFLAAVLVLLSSLSSMAQDAALQANSLAVLESTTPSVPQDREVMWHGCLCQAWSRANAAGVMASQGALLAVAAISQGKQRTFPAARYNCKSQTLSEELLWISISITLPKSTAYIKVH